MVDNTPDRSRLEETEKTHSPNNAKNLRTFLVFRIILNDLYQIIIHLNTLTHPLSFWKTKTLYE